MYLWLSTFGLNQYLHFPTHAIRADVCFVG